MFEVIKPSKKELTKSFRISKDLVDKIDKICKKENITFSEFIIQTIMFAMNNVEK